jgi:FixJ family two-component response regulator
MNEGGGFGRLPVRERQRRDFALGQPLSETIIIHVVDDDDLLRASLADLLHSVGYAAKTYSSARMFLDDPPGDEPGCVIADVRMPGLSGLELQSALGRIAAGLPVIVMTGFGDVRMSVQAMKAGAIDFLEKPFRDQDLLDAVETALEADRNNRAGGARTQGLQMRFDTLTAREREVMAMVCDGKLNKEVAGALSLSEVTVKVHRGSAMKKMGAKTAADLSRMATLLRLKEG